MESLNYSSTVTGVSGRNREDVRQHNLSTLLRLLHLQGSVSRSNLTSATGLNRSTISDLVSELAELGLITEAESVSPSGVGRPSLMVSSTDNAVSFAVHPEIDATTVGVVSLSGRVLSKVRIPMTSAPTATESMRVAAGAITKLRAKLTPSQKIAGIGIAVPGQVRVSDNVVRLAPHLGWIEESIGAMLEQATGLPTFVDNDASLGCLAEANFGAARGATEVVYLYAGSGGIGGGAIVNGRQLHGAAGYGGELGHVKVSDSAGRDYSGISGTLESLVSRDELLDAMQIYAATDEEIEQVVLGSPSTKVKKVLNKQIDYLGIGLANYVNIFNPDVVVLAGFLTSVFKFDPERLIDKIQEGALAASKERVVIRVGELGSNLLMVGAAEPAFRSLISRPAEAQLYKAR